MPNNIIVLDDVLASKIAAGEVVERPASVVKELIENSIDAGASRIEVEIHNAGKSLIRVTDNGSGMNPEDAELSLQRHATSKISTAEDLFNISTLGFRGEALPSIASVSRLELATSNGQLATKIICDSGKITEKENSSSPKGTTIIVKDLFFNTPARLKFLKSDSTEMNQITDSVSRAVLACPKISFRLTHNGKEILSSSGNGDLLDAISSVYGQGFAKTLVPVGHGSVRGYISKPGDTKINRNYQIFFVNNRNVRNFALSKAVESAYLSLIPKDKHPSAVIFTDVDPKEIDVNVHPTKKEIKFQKNSEVMHAIAEAVREALVDVTPAQIISSMGSSSPQKWATQGERVWIEEQGIGYRVKGVAEGDKKTFELIDVPMNNSGSATYAVPTTPYTLHPSPCPVPIAQLSNSYIICIEDGDLILIDQHAAHERILYERLKAKNKSETSSQCCLIPEVIELTPAEFRSAEENMDTLKELGFDIEAFGKDSVRIKAVPSEVRELDMKKLFSEIAQQAEEGTPGKGIENEKDRIMKLTACHGAIKAGDPLKPEEINTLLKQLYAIPNPSTCPHGRPSIVRIENKKIASFFDRQK